MTSVIALRRMSVTQDTDSGHWHVLVWTAAQWADTGLRFGTERDANMFVSCNPRLEA